MCSGGLGFGLPAAVGVALARPERARDRADRRRLGDVHDPGAVERGAAKLPMTFVILKNRRYAALQDFAPQLRLRAGRQARGQRSAATSTSSRWPPGMGVAGRRVERCRALREALAQALRSAAPILLEVEVA